jgi:hypothetical protein
MLNKLIARFQGLFKVASEKNAPPSQPAAKLEVVANPFVDDRMPSRLNACVGENGWPGIHTYIDGYDEAAKHLGKKMLRDENISIDALIYPFLFSARHRIELSIKSLIMTISELVGRSNECSALLLRHDLQILWDKYVDLSDSFDRRYAAENKKITDIVIGFFVVDPTGQTFRYPFRSEDKKRHLVDYSVINIGVVYAKYVMISEWFDFVEELTRSLSEEFRLGTRTNKLSRRDLFEIADTLPDRKDWKNANFKDIKEKIKEDFGFDGNHLSSRDLTKALDIIQKHRQLSAKIGKEIPINTITCQSLIEFVHVKHLCERIPRGKNDEEREARIAALDFLNRMTDEAVATVLAFYSLGREVATYSEQYDMIFSDHMHSLNDYRRGHLMYLLSKSSFISGMIEGMEMTGQISFLSCLSEHGFYPLPPEPESEPDEEWGIGDE